MQKKKVAVIRPNSQREWLMARERGIGASEVAAVIGISPWQTPFSLWLLKTGQIPPIEETQAMKMGKLLEPVIAQLWEEATGWKIVKASAKDIIYQDPEHPWRLVTPDRFAYEIDPETGKKSKCLLEFKATSQDFDPNELPSYYVAQCQYQMHVTGVHVNYLCWLTNGRYYNHARLEYDEEFATFIAERVDEFWNESVVGGKEPELISVEDFTFKGSTPGTVVEADDKALGELLSLRKLNEILDRDETEANQLKEAIKLYMGENESISFDGKVLATWKTGARGRTFRLKDKNIDELINKEDEEDGTE